MTNQNPETGQTYEEFLRNIINELQNLKNDGAEISALMCVCQLDPSKDNSKMRKSAIESLNITKS